VLGRNQDLAGVVPVSGTLLSTDLWVVPTQGTGATAPTSVQGWIGFYWQPAIAEQLTLLSYGASPVLTRRDRTTLAAALQNDPLLFPSADLLSQSETLAPLSPEAIAQYKTLWANMRGSVPPTS
jgi:putative spermidine/putrescine transport system substrate-binding protein